MPKTKHPARPPSLRTHIDPLDAETLHEFEPTYVFMSGEEIAEECRAILDALPPLPPYFAYLHRNEPLDTWLSLALRFQALFRGGSEPSADTLQRALAPLPRSEKHLLACRLHQIIRAVQVSVLCHGTDWNPTNTFAVPPMWKKRFETLIGGMLCPAFVVFVDVGRF